MLELLKLSRSSDSSQTRGFNCLNCGKLNVTQDHDINCQCTANYRTKRHQHIVDAVQAKINIKRRPRPVFKSNLNLIDGGGRPDIEFYINGKRYILDVVFSQDSVLEVSY